jgi:sulfide:quinone oxidoreductase
MAHVAIVGAGIAGVPCAYELRKRLGRQHRVTLIGCSAFFEFTPSNPWLVVGWRQREDTRVQLRGLLESKGVEWIADSVKTIDATDRWLLLRNGNAIQYDFLVIATGPKQEGREARIELSGGKNRECFIQAPNRVLRVLESVTRFVTK